MTGNTDPPELSVIIPTYNERENLTALVAQVLEVLEGISVEVIIVDDASTDGTGGVARQLHKTNERIRLLARDGKQGLASAVFDGAAMAIGTHVAVIDADFSHDPEELPDMLAKAREGYDVVIGSRFASGSAFVGQPLSRQMVSWLANLGARLVLLLGQRDVLTGFALCRRELITEMPSRYSASGFKWLLELLTTQRALRVYELPIVFHDRRAGDSKASVGEALSLALLCGRLALWRMRRPDRKR